MTVCALATGSSGNAFYVGTDTTKILVDCGLSRPEICLRLSYIDRHPNDIDGILLTHEHTDHSCGLRGMTRSYRIPIYCSERTDAALRLSDVAPDLWVFRSAFTIGDLSIQPIAVEHDAVNPVAYRITAKDGKAAVIATDLALVSDELIEHARSANFVFLEANHDTDMVLAGAWPRHLKNRVLGSHLSNDRAAAALTRMDNTRGRIVLGHISEGNNDLRLLRLVMRDFNVEIAEPGAQTNLFTV